MKSLIFGCSGQDGHYLAEICRNSKIEPFGISRTESNFGNKGNVCDYKFVESIIKEYKPEFIFHLAANSTTRHDVMFENHETIVSGTMNILEAAKQHSPKSKIFVTGSALQFKNTGQPISETDEFDPSSAYAVSRIQSVYAARYYRALGLAVYVGYLFHHESPLRKPGHVSQFIATAVKRIKGGSEEKISVGDLSVRKEWTFAGDVARAIFTLVSQDEIFESAIGSGITYSIEDWLSECFGLIGKDWREFVRTIQGFESDYQCMISNPSTMKSLSWQPEVSFKDLAEMMVSC